MKNETYQIFQAFYALVKHILGIPRKRTSFFIKFLLIILTLITLILFGIFFIGSIILYIFIKACIMYKERNKFAGMMTGQDPLLAPYVVHCLYTVKGIDNPESYRNALERLLQNLHGSCNKMNYLIRSYWGYYYYVKSNLNLNDYVHEVESSNFWTQSSILDYIENNVMTNNRIGDKTWMMTIFKQPIIWVDGSKKYVFILSFNHSVSDGFGLFSLVKNKCCDKLEFLNLSTRINSDVILNQSLDEAYVLPVASPEYQDENHKDIFTFFIEVNPKYLKLIRHLKKKFNVGFTQILVSGFVVALKEYMDKKNIFKNKIVVNYTFRPFDAEAIKMIDGNFNFDNMRNKVFIGSSYIDSSSSNNILSAALNMNRSLNEYLKSVNLVFTKVLINITHLLPPWFNVGALFMNKVVESNIFVTNVTGIKYAGIENLDVDNIVFFLSPGVFNLGLCVLTYDNKLNIGLQSNTGVIDNRDDFNRIVARAFEHIDSLENQ